MVAVDKVAGTGEGNGVGETTDSRVAAYALLCVGESVVSDVGAVVEIGTSGEEGAKVREVGGAGISPVDGVGAGDVVGRSVGVLIDSVIGAWVTRGEALVVADEVGDRVDTFDYSRVGASVAAYTGDEEWARAGEVADASVVGLETVSVGRLVETAEEVGV